MGYWERTHYDDKKYGVRPKFKYSPTIPDPTDLYVPGPERGGVKLGGCMVEREVAEVIDQVLDRNLFRFKTKSDIIRTAVTHFVMDQLHPAVERHPYRFRAYLELLQLDSEIYREDQNAKMLERAEKLYQSKPQHRKEILGHLRTYANSLIEDHHISDAKELFGKSAVLGMDFIDFLATPTPPDPEDVEFQRQLDMDRARVDSMDSDDALEALAREESDAD